MQAIVGSLIARLFALTQIKNYARGKMVLTSWTGSPVSVAAKIHARSPKTCMIYPWMGHRERGVM